ncbi:hypothetical protein ACNKHQ_05375 [Shigella flexneri]
MDKKPRLCRAPAPVGAIYFDAPWALTYASADRLLDMRDEEMTLRDEEVTGNFRRI